MSPFEFVTVLISIILGLGITQIMSGIADLIHQWKMVRLYWPHLLWIVLVFVLHVQDWWLLYQLKGISTWRLPGFLFQVLYPISLFIMARLLFPMTAESQTDMRSYYFENYRKFFAMVMVLTAVSAAENIMYHNLGVEGWLVNAMLFAALAYLFVRKELPERLHQVLAIALLIIMISGIVYNVDEWAVSP